MRGTQLLSKTNRSRYSLFGIMTIGEVSSTTCLPIAGVLALNVICCFATKPDRPAKSLGFDKINHPEIFDGESLHRKLSIAIAPSRTFWFDRSRMLTVFGTLYGVIRPVVFKLVANALAPSNRRSAALLIVKCWSAV